MEFSLQGNDYRAGKLSVFEQLNVSRKLLPVLAGLVKDLREHPAGTAMETLLPNIASAVSALHDDDVNAILLPCLSVVSRKHMKSWVPVCVEGDMRFDDIDLLVMLQLVARVVADSLGNFLPDVPTRETSAPTAG
nr:hypothetical protein [uncultured Enterobacter sp.]